MHRDRKNGTWLELKAKIYDKFDNLKYESRKFDDTPSNSLNVVHGHLDGETHDIQKVKKDRTSKQLSRVQNMLKDMSDYANKNSESN